MTNPALTWISDAHKGGYLRAAFIDCQISELNSIGDVQPFLRAKALAENLRAKTVPITHFYYDPARPHNIQPFQFSEANNEKFPHADLKFSVVTPLKTEWVIPKSEFNGFTNPYSNLVFKNYDGHPDTTIKSVLICAGFTARCCLWETAIGSFNKAANPDLHRVIISLDGTNLHPNYHEGYALDQLERVDDSLKDKIGFLKNSEIFLSLRN
jgi:hypothetical protein